jgi:antitoxin component HigA of HigAB toxin-antitoxin module
LSLNLAAESLIAAYTQRMPPQPRHVALTARLERIKQLADDLARAHGSETAVSRGLADRMKREADVVRRALKRLKS